MCTCVSVCTWECALGALRRVAVNNLGTLFCRYAVVVVQDQTSGALAARHAGLETVALYHPQWHVGVKAGFGARRSALVKHKSPLHWTAHSWGRQAQRRRKHSQASTAKHQVTCEQCCWDYSIGVIQLLITDYFFNQ